tara:strand:- start:274 stop:591 length:318 start_codon:yes stop_codon:yes gene_type:complete
MSYKWPDKDPDETIDYSVDWSRFIPNDTLSASTWFVQDAAGAKEQVSNAEVVDGLQFVQSTISGKVATARFALGTNNKQYKVTCQITTGDGLVFERSIFLKIKEK